MPAESFTVRLPEHLCRRLRFLADENKVTPEAFIACQTAQSVFDQLDQSRQSLSMDETADWNAVERLNTPKKGGRRD